MKKRADLLSISTMMGLLILTSTSKAAETEQFYASKAVIRDSSAELNDYYQQKIELGLFKSNQKTVGIACNAVAEEVLTQILGEFSITEYVKDKTFSLVSYFTQNSPLIERFPDESISGKDYRANSIYKHRPFPVNAVGIARTINVNGIYMGTDKIGHFSIIGRTYYKNYQAGLALGLTSKQAEEVAIRKGFKQEVGILGYDIGGTLAFGDLEANFKGYQFARNMCEGSNPHLIQINGKWIQNPSNQFDIKQYVTPKMDEAYNVSLWSPRVWKKIKKELVGAFCKNKMEPEYILRVAGYNKILKSTINDELLDSFVKENPKFDRNKQLLDKNINCDSL